MSFFHNRHSGRSKEAAALEQLQIFLRVLLYVFFFLDYVWRSLMHDNILRVVNTLLAVSSLERHSSGLPTALETFVCAEGRLMLKKHQNASASAFRLFSLTSMQYHNE